MKLIQENTQLTEEEKKTSKRNISIEIRQIKEDLLSPLSSNFRCQEQYHAWLNEHKPKIVPKDRFMKNNILYDLKANPMDYLYGMIHICQELQAFDSYHHAIPLRTSLTPCYLTLDTTALIMLMIDDNAIHYRKNVKQVKQEVWETFFCLDNKAFRRKDYCFHHMIKTDGVGASILFHRKDQNPNKLDDGSIIQSENELYVDEIVNPLDVQDKNVVGIDGGLDDILHCTDGNNFYRYTANQRRVQTKSKKYMKLMDGLKKDTFIDGKSIKEWETILSQHNKYTCSFDDYKAYLRAKFDCYTCLYKFYLNPLIRKLKWNSYINRQRSEAKMINQIKKYFGEPETTVISIGDWDQKGHHMKGKEPTKGKGMRMVLRRAGFQVYLVDEFRTSCKCHRCHENVEKCLYRESKRPKTFGQMHLVHGLLSCQTANGCSCLWNRDVNGCLNIRMLALTAFKKEERPLAFRRERIHTQ